jgi:hypothetical protein
MKRLGAIASFILFATAASAQVAAPPLPQNDPFVGTWQINPQKSRPRPDKTDSSYVRTITRDGDELVFSSRTGGSKPKEHNYKIRCDGLFHPVPFGSMSCRYTTPNAVEGESRPPNSKEDASRTAFWRREVTADGQEMKILAYTDSGRTQLESIQVLDRVK